MGNPGQSADEQAKRLMDEAGKWAAGAEGERRVAAALSSLPDGWTVVHDRLLRPGRSEANLDHIVVGPTGIYLVDAKNRAGRVTEHEGGLFQHRRRDGRSESVSLAAELKKVHGMGAYMAAESDRPVTPVLCLAGAQAAEFGEPRMVRGVWVVPVTALPGWLRSRPVIIPAEVIPTVATRVITDFPSTSTDAALLSAMSEAATSPRAAGRGRPGGHPRQRDRGPKPRAAPARSARTVAPRRWRRVVGRLGQLVMIGLFLGGGALLFANLPAILTAAVERLADTGAASTPSVTGTATATAAPAKATASTKKAAAKGAAAKPPKTPKPLGPPDCADATAAEIKAIIQRTVQPVLTSRGCSWGTRLDDDSTVLVKITMSADHGEWDAAMTTSVKQKRVVFADAYLGMVGRSTMASVAAGQPIVRGAKPVRARADTVVIVASTSLGVSDDRAREMAVAIAAAANAGG